MSKTLTFHHLSEKFPEHGQEVLYWRTDDFYSLAIPTFARAEYHWVEVDEEGFVTGSSMAYEPGEETPEGYVLRVVFADEDGGYTPKDDALWCPVEDVDSLFPEEA